jgi:hypothetical protein
MSKPRPLDDAERKLATVTAQLVARAEEARLPDPPDKLGITPAAIRLLARAYLELLDQVRAVSDAFTKVGLAHRPFESADLHTKFWRPVANLHAKLWLPVADLDLIVRAQNTLKNAGISYVGELVQADKRTLRRLKNFGKVSLKEVEEALAAKDLCLGQDLDGWPGPRWECHAEHPYLRKVGPQVIASPPTHTATVVDPLLALYCRVMREMESAFVKHESYVVRAWDGMDGCWTDCTGEVGRDEALRCWAEKTDGGTRHVAYAEIDYYRIFPGDTRMLWDGSEGREMHR